jgi:hypothetical protein
MDEDPKRPGAWGLIEDAIAEHEVEQVGALSGEALVAEMKKAGLDPERAKVILQNAIADADAVPDADEGAAGGAAGGAAPPGRGSAWSLIESAIAEHDAEAAKPAKVVSLDERRKRRWTRLTLLLVAASYPVYLAVTTGGGGVASSPAAVAKELREQAFAACNDGNAALCKAKLDEAKKLFPEGEEDRRVVRARARIKELEQGQEKH